MACSMVSVARQQQPAPRQTAAGDRLGEQLEAHLKMEAGRVLVNYVTLGMVALNWWSVAATAVDVAAELPNAYTHDSALCADDLM